MVKIDEEFFKKLEFFNFGQPKSATRNVEKTIMGRVIELL